MKIGILTYHRSHNFGAVLQAYALRTVLMKHGFNVELVDYWPSYRDSQYKLLSWDVAKNSGLGPKVKALLKDLLVFPEKYVRYNKFKNFISEKLSVKGEPVSSGIDISGNYDIIVCGSDQIWRYNTFSKMTGFDEVYFGKYPVSTTIKKIAYAASMGVESFDVERLQQFTLLLKNFQQISVREDTLANKVREAGFSSVTQVLDPVFLLSTDEWLKLVRPVRSKKYLLFYQLLECPEAVELAKNISKENGLEIVQIVGNIQPLSWFSKVQTTTGPIDFISLIAGADYVISTSFHGVAFSVLFKKQFSALGFGKNGSRVASLLRGFGILDRFLDGGANQPETPIDYDVVDKRLKHLRESSLQFLLSSLK